MVKKLYLLFACFAICLGVVAQDKKVAIGSATVSSYHNGEGADKAIDGETSTIWHSGNGGGYTTSFPVTFTIAFREVCHVDYVRYIPRLDGNSNGNWKDVKVSYSSNTSGNEFTYLDTYDLQGIGSVFDFPIGQACGKVKFEILSGQGGWASAAEIEAYVYDADKQAAFARYFTDDLYTQLKSGVTSSDGIADADVKALVSSMLDNASEYKKFRVGEYEAYETLGTLQQRLKTKNQYSRYENPTGVYFSEGQSYLVAVSGIEDDAVGLKVKNWYTSESSSTYSLHNGLNYIMATTEGNVFVNYYTDNYAKASKVKVHFINVPVIGYWDQNMTNDDWVDLLADKAYDDHRIIITQSEHAQLAFPISAWKTHCPTDVEALMEHYQNVQWALRDMMGLEKYGYQTKNRQLFYTVNGGFMAAGEEGAYCDYADLGGIMNVNSFDFWGVGHEWGHNNQIHPGFHWSGCGETTNNIYASWAQYHFTDNRDADGKPTYLRLEDEVTGVNDYSNMRGGRMQTYFEEGLRKGIQWQLQDGPDYHNVTPDTKVVTGCDAEGNNLGQVTTTSRNYDHFVKLAPFWQLNLWGNLANKCPDIITDVIHRIRTTDNYAAIYNTNGKQQINWMKLACDVAGIDLLPFFEKAGMLVPIHAYIEDYGAGWNIIDEQMIANLKAYVKQKGYPSYTEEINYINAHNMYIYRDNLKLNVTAIEGTLNGDKVNIQHSVAQNAVAFETYNVHDELIRITMYGLGSDDAHSYTQVLFPSSQDAAYIMAVGYNGDRQKVYQKHDSEEGGITSLSKLSNGVLYHISQPHHSVGATSWAVQAGGMALKSNADLSINVDRTDIRQQFAFVSNDGGSTRYLYHVAESKFVNKDGSLGIKPMDAISLKPGAYSNTFVAYFDEFHYVNVGGSRQMIIDDWKTSDGGNSCVILPVGEFDVTAALKAFVVEVASITLSDSQVNLVEGDSLLLVATVTPEDATDKRIVWSSSNPLVATVDSSGKVTAVSSGTTTITASSGGKSASCVVTVEKFVGITSVSELKNGDLYHIYQPHHSHDATSWAVQTGGMALKSNADLSINVDRTDIRQQFAFVSNDGGSTRYLYHVSESKFVNKDGSLGTKPLDAISFKAGAYSNTFVAYFDESHYVNVGGSRQMTIDGWTTPDGGNSCVILPVGEFDATEALKALVVEVTGITLSDSLVDLIEGDSLLLVATVTPANATDRRVVWSSSDSLVATVDPSGKVTAVSSGTAAITASCGGKSSSCAVTVERPLGITSLSELGNGVIYHISQPHHSSGATSWVVQTDGVALKSSADLDIAIDRKDIRQQFAFVSNDGGSTRYLYHVAESKFVNKDGSLGIKPMDAISLKSGAYSNTFVAYFDESHYVNVGGSRQMIIDDWKASDGGNSCVILPVGEFDVTAALKAFVVEVASITLSDSQVNLVEGDSLLLVATVTPEDATDKRIVWSSNDPLVASVDTLGKVTAVSSGTTTITASSGGKSASCVVTVEKFLGITSVSELKNGDLYHIYQPHHSHGATSWAVQAGGMALKSNADLSINVDRMDIRQQFAFVSNDGGSTRYLYHVAESKFVNKDGSLGIKPMDAISLKSGAYSNTFVAYFDESHYVNVGGSRQMIIDDWKTSDGGNSCVILPVGEFDVTAALKAFVVEVASITLSDSQVNLVEGDSLLLVATVTPDDATDKRIVWSSSDPLVASVDTLGRVTAVSPGAATITASSGTVSASCDVVVSRKYIPVEEIVLSDSLVSLIEGNSLLLFATVTPDDATDKRIVWSSSDSLVATVDSLGKVTAVSPGAATITASSGTVSASCDVVVSRKYIPVEGVILDVTSADLIVGDSLMIRATVYPDNATDKTILWSSSNDAVASVDSNGTIVALSVGTAIIRATSNNYEASCVIVVNEVDNISSTQLNEFYPVDIYDMKGRLVKKRAFSISNLKEGFYLIKGRKYYISK